MLAQGVDIVDDGLFVAHYGELAYRASTVAYPVRVAVVAVAVGTSIGVNSVLSRALGRHDGRGARSVKANALFLALAGAAVCLAAGLFSSSPIARCLTRDVQTQSLVTSYLRIYLIGAGTLFLSVTFERFPQAHGLMRECMLVQVTGVVVNLALDPLLIFVLDLGLVGARLGTVLGQVASGALALGFYLRGVGMPIEARPNAASCCDTHAVALPVHGCCLSATADRAPSALRADYGHGGGIFGVPCLRCGWRVRSAVREERSGEGDLTR